MKIFLNGLIAACLLLAPCGIQGVNYIIQDLETLSTEKSTASCINNQNVIVGKYEQANRSHDFIFELGKGLTFLPRSTAYQFPLINNLNQVAGIFWHKTRYWFQPNVRTKHLYFYENGTVKDLNFPNGWRNKGLEDWQTLEFWDEEELKVIGFNDHQQFLVANSSEVSNATKFAFRRNGVYEEIDSDAIGIAYALNNQGLILGRKWKKDENVNTPYLVLYNPANESTIEIMKDINIIHRRLNDAGQVIVTQTLNNAETKSLLWDSQTGFTHLGEFLPHAFNNVNQIVGFLNSEPVLWTTNEMIPLSSYIGLNDAESIWSKVISFNGINDNGYIIGEGLFDGKSHAFVLIPQSE